MNLVRFLALLGALAAALRAQTTHVVPAKPITSEAAVKGPLEDACSGNEVLLSSWMPSTGDVHTIEIYPNTQSDVKGRCRAGTARSNVVVFHDKGHDDQTYWQ